LMAIIFEAAQALGKLGPDIDPEELAEKRQRQVPLYLNPKPLNPTRNTCKRGSASHVLLVCC
jgi:hypothetical protein